MWVKVYRLREGGQRLPGIEVERRGAVEGELLYRPKAMQRREWSAHLVQIENGVSDDVIPFMDPAVMVEVSAKGTLITGREIICTGVRRHELQEFRQSWWCVAAPRLKLLGTAATPPIAARDLPPVADELWAMRA